MSFDRTNALLTTVRSSSNSLSLSARMKLNQKHTSTSSIALTDPTEHEDDVPFDRSKALLTTMRSQHSLSLSRVINLNEKHASNSSLAPTGHEASAANVLRQIEIPKQIFTTTSEKFRITPFKNLWIRGDKASMRHDIVLEDSQSKVPIAVCKLMFTGLVPYKIYTTKPNFPGQKKSARKHNKKTALYTYAELHLMQERKKMKLNLKTPDSDKNSAKSYTIETAGPMCRVVMEADQPVALMQGDKSPNSIRLNVSNGIDPCLMICLASICCHLGDIEVHE